MAIHVDVGGARQYLTLRAGADEYLIDVGRVRQILRYAPDGTLNASSPWLCGYVVSHGRALPIVDLSAKLGDAAAQRSARSSVVVIEGRVQGESVLVGLLADGVSQVVVLVPDAIQPPPTFGPHVALDYLSGVAQVAGRLALLLDVDGIFSLDEILVIAAAMDEVGSDGPAPGRRLNRTAAASKLPG